MRPRPPFASAVAAVLAVTFAVGATTLIGCGANAGAGPGARAAGGETGAAAREVPDDRFAASVRDLLLTDPGSTDRAARLAGVMARQMIRAQARFRAKQPDRGLASVIGGLTLARRGEVAAATLGASGRASLREAARELASRGDEGRARAIYEILARVGDPAEVADAKLHLDALGAWTRDAVGKGGPVARAGALQRVAFKRALVEPSEAARDEAAALTIDWIKKSVTLRQSYRSTRLAPARDEAQEAFRGLQVGGTLLAALYVRDGDAAGALRALELAQAKDELVPDPVVAALEALARRPDAAHYVQVLQALRPAPAREEDDLGEERELFRAIAFRAAVEAYRLDPTNVDVAAQVAAGLMDNGMAEAAPAVLVDAARANADPRSLGGMLALSMQAMAIESEANDVDGARRTFRAAEPLLQIAASPELAGRVQPSAARARALMGDIELREGNVTAARQHFAQAAAMEPTGVVLQSLARIELHGGQPKEALEHLQQALTAPDTGRAPALKGEIQLMLGDAARERGDTRAARAALTDALRTLTAGRSTRDADDRARVERTLARVLDRFGAAEPAQKALERAFQATPRDKQQTAATAGQLVGRALVRGDVAGARDGLSRALAADVSTDDLVYFALWVRLLERQLRVPSDGAPQRIFAGVPDDGRWIGRLAGFGAGKVKADALLASAKTQAQQTEALFYIAMDRRAAGDAKGGEDGLRKVLSGSGLELMEMGFARDLLSGPSAQLGGLPPDVKVP